MTNWRKYLISVCLTILSIEGVIYPKTLTGVACWISFGLIGYGLTRMEE